MKKIVIIGGGIIGATIAYELSLNPSFDITLLEEENTSAFHSTGAALGVLMGFIRKKIKGRGWKLSQESLTRYETLIPELEILTGKKIHFNQQGILKLLFPEDNMEGWQNLIKIRENQGYHLEIWDKKQLFSQCPSIEIDSIIGGVYSPQDRQVNPRELTEALLTGAKLNGVKVKFGVKVQNFPYGDNQEDNNSNWENILTSEGEIKTDWVIIAGGIGSTELTKNCPQPLDIRPVLGQALQIEVKENINQSKNSFNPVITGNDVHIVPLNNNQYWIGATVEFPNEKGEIICEEKLLEEIIESAFSILS
jgi:glycine oxidase